MPKHAKPKIYDKYIVQTLDEYLIISINGKTDHSSMQKQYKPIILNLKKHGILKAINIIALLKQLGIDRKGQFLLIQMIQEKCKGILITLTKRQLSHTNSLEKNILLTYFSYHEPYVTYLAIVNFLKQRDIKVKDQDQNLLALLIEITKIHGKPITFLNLSDDVSDSSNGGSSPDNDDPNPCSDSSNDDPNSCSDSSNDDSNSCSNFDSDNNSNSSSNDLDSYFDDLNDILNTSSSNTDILNDHYFNQHNEDDFYSIINEDLFDNQYESDDEFNQDFSILYN